MIEENATMNARGGQKLPKPRAERLEEAETAFEEREVEPTELDVNLDDIEASAVAADAKLREAEENIRKVEREHAFTEKELERFEAISRRREENIGRLKRAINAVREKVFGKKETSPEDRDADTLMASINEQLAEYRNDFFRDLKQAEEKGTRMANISVRFRTIINNSEDAFIEDPKGTLANILENIGIPNPDQTAEQAWSIGKAGAIFKKFIDTMRLASRWQAKKIPEGSDMDIDIEEAAPENATVTGVEQALAKYGIKSERGKTKVEIRQSIDAAIAEPKKVTSENPIVNEINGWSPELSENHDERNEQLISLKEKWQQTMRSHERNASPETVKSAIKTYLEIVRGKPVDASEAETIWASGQGGAVLGSFDMRMKNYFKDASARFPDFERAAMKKKVEKAQVAKTFLDIKRPRKATPKKQAKS